MRLFPSKSIQFSLFSVVLSLAFCLSQLTGQASWALEEPLPETNENFSQEAQNFLQQDTTEVEKLLEKEEEAEGKLFLFKSKGKNKIEKISIDKDQRDFLVHIPPHLLETNNCSLSKIPLVFVLHGAKEPRKISQITTGFDKIADIENFIVVYPGSINQQWNDGRLPEDTPAYPHDDVKFMSNLIDYMVEKYNVDPKRVYVTGFSSGGMMSQRLAMEIGHKIAAIAPVASSLPRPLYNLNQKPSRPMPVLMINGTQDIAFPWAGGKTSIIGIKVGDVLPITDTLNYWLTVNGGASHQPDVNTCKNEKNDGTKVEVSYFPTNQHACVIFYKVIGGGHTWPGGNIPLRYIPFLGKESQNLSASELIWEFFKRNALPEIPEISKNPLSQNSLSAEAN